MCTRIILSFSHPLVWLVHHRAVLWIWIRINFFGRLDPDADPGWQQMANKKKWRNFTFQVLDVLCWGQKASPVALLSFMEAIFDIRKDFLSAVQFYNFWSSKPWIVWIDPICWIQICIETNANPEHCQRGMYWIRHPLRQCWGFVTFWCGSGSSDLYLWLMDPDPTPDPTPFFSDFKDAKKNNSFTCTLFSVLKI